MKTLQSIYTIYSVKFYVYIIIFYMYIIDIKSSYKTKCSVTWRLKADIVERVEVVMARQRHGEHVSAATYTVAKLEDAVFSMRSAPKLYNEEQAEKPVSRQSIGGRNRRLDFWVVLLDAATKQRLIKI
jgi:hypothetical protein